MTAAFSATTGLRPQLPLLHTETAGPVVHLRLQRPAQGAEAAVLGAVAAPVVAEASCNWAWKRSPAPPPRSAMPCAARMRHGHHQSKK